MSTNYKYKSLGDFRKANISEYGHLHHKGLLERLCSDMGWDPPRNPRGYWTYERCKEEASNFTTIKDWREASLASYNHSLKKGWFDEFSACMTRAHTPNSYWTKELCVEEARKCSSKTEWAKSSPSSLKVSKKNGWYEECIIHMVEHKKPIGYWTKELCVEEARKFKTKKEWKHGSSGSYTVSRKNKWIDELSGHMEEYLKPPGYWTLERCMEQALNYNVKEHWKKGHPPSYQGARVHGHYDECTKHMVEITKPPGYWTKERCIEDAKKFTTISDWHNANSTPVTNARANGWYDECTAHMIRVNKPAGYWLIKDNCLEEALKYSSIKDWSNKSSASYHQSRANDWYEECIAHMKKQKIRLDSWTKESCLEEALKYKSRSEWQKKHNNSFRAAKANGWYDECTKHMVVLKNKESYWTKERCHEKALMFTSRKEWKQNHATSHSTANKNRWMNECCSHMVKYKKPSMWSSSKCHEQALKYKTKMEWKNNHSPSYHAALKYGWLDECCTHMSGRISKPHGYWTKERCIEDALKYNKKIEWVNAKTSYQAARVNGWIDECSGHMNVRKITKEICLEEALKHKIKTDWKNNHSPSYHAALRYGWMDECSTHMIELLKPSGYWNVKERCLEEALKYKSKNEWHDKSNGSRKAAKANGWYDECTAHMK